jgi:hypothetical protein
LAAVHHRDVVVFRLVADRRPLLGGMLAVAIVEDLLTIVVELQAQPIPTLVLVDEFSAVAPQGVVRLFGRGRSAGLSLLLGTQELADLRPPDNPSLADQVLDNVTTLIAHRQVVPASARRSPASPAPGGRGHTPSAPRPSSAPASRQASAPAPGRASSSSTPTPSSACPPATQPSPAPVTATRASPA